MRRIGKRATVLATLLLVMLIGIGIGIGLQNRSKVYAQEETALPEQTITVSGYAEKSVRPGIAYVTVGVRTQKPDMKAAQADNVKEMDAVLKAVKAKGIDEKDIQTQAFYVNPVYDQDTWTKITAFEVIHTVRVKVKEIDRAGEIIDAAIAAGANNSNGISFDITQEERDRLYNEALKDAVKTGEAKAKVLAESVGKTIGEPVRIIEGGSSSVEPYYEARDKMAAAEYAGAGTTISPGEMNVGATVTLVYSTK